MKNKISQKTQVKRMIKERGYVTRNSALNRKITRLSAIIQTLEEEGFKFNAFAYEGDWVYKQI